MDPTVIQANIDAIMQQVANKAGNLDRKHAKDAHALFQTSKIKVVAAAGSGVDAASIQASIDAILDDVGSHHGNLDRHHAAIAHELFQGKKISIAAA